MKYNIKHIVKIVFILYFGEIIYMGKIKKYFSEQKEVVTDVCKRYIATWISFALLFVLLVIFDLLEEKIASSDIEMRVSVVLLVTGSMCFLFESMFDGNKLDKLANKLNITVNTLRIISYILSFVYGVVFEEIVYYLDTVADTNDISREIIIRVLTYIFIQAILFGFYFTIENTGLDIGDYIRTTLGNIAGLLCTFGLINLGLIIVLALFDTLIFSISLWDWIGNLELIIVALVYVPLLLYSITDKKASKTGKAKIIFYRWALMPLVMAATVIIYLYLFKVILGIDDSNNVIYTPCMWLFIIGAPIWEMSNLKEFDEDNSLWNKIIKNMSYIYAPLILLEIYAMGVRIVQYGLTPNRYMAIMFIIFQIAYVFWKWGEKRKLLLVVAGLITIAMVVPLANIFYSCYASQRARFAKNYGTAVEIAEKVSENDDREYLLSISEEDRKSVKNFVGAYSYLKYDVRGDKYICQNYDEEKIAQYSRILDSILSKDKYMSSDYEDQAYIRYHSEDKKINISGYSYIYSINDDRYDDNDYDYFKSYQLEYGNNYEKAVVDLTNVIDKLNAHYNDTNDNNKENNEPIEVNIDWNKKLIITNIRYTNVKNKGIYRGFEITGYILEK